MRRMGVSEILKVISNIADPAERQNAMAACVQNNTVLQLLKLMFDPNIVFELPEGAPPYKENEFMDQQNNLYGEWRKMYLFVRGGTDNLKPFKREVLFVQLLETIDREDAKLLIAMKDKYSPYPNITYDLVARTFPGLLPERQENDVVINTYVKPVEAKTVLAYPCPFGCVSTRGKNSYQPGPLVKHMKQVHNYTDEQVVEFKKEHFV